MKKNLYPEAIRCMRLRLKVIAFDANLWDRGMVPTEETMPHAKSYSEERKRILAEIKLLEGPQQLKLLEE